MDTSVTTAKRGRLLYFGGLISLATLAVSATYAQQSPNTPPPETKSPPPESQSSKTESSPTSPASPASAPTSTSAPPTNRDPQASSQASAQAPDENTDRSTDSPSRWRMVIQREVTVRVPMHPSAFNNRVAAAKRRAEARANQNATRAAKQARVAWREVPAPRCIAVRRIHRVRAVQRDSIDLLTRNRQLVRAHLHRGCRVLDFYSGFYMQPNADGRLCANRDVIQARSGAQCKVDRLGLIVPVRQRPPQPPAPQSTPRTAPPPTVTETSAGAVGDGN